MAERGAKLILARDNDWRPLGDCLVATIVRTGVGCRWVVAIGLRSEEYGTHSLRRTKASIIYKATGTLCAWRNDRTSDRRLA